MASLSSAAMNLVEQFCTTLKRQHMDGSLQTAKRTAEVFRTVIGATRFDDASTMIEDVRALGALMQRARPAQLSVGNVARRILHLIREEAEAEEAEEAEGAEDELEEEAPGTPEREHSQVSEHGQLQAENSTQSIGSARKGVPPGTRVLRPVASGRYGRAMSLANLLDTAAGQATAPPSHRSGGSQDMGAEAAGGGRLGSNREARMSHTSIASIPEEEDQSDRARARYDAAGKPKRHRPPQWARKANVIEGISELLADMESIYEQIAVQGPDHVHAHEVILTTGCSDEVEAFLLEVHQRKRRPFSVVVAEGSPKCEGILLARRLAEAGVPTTVITDAAVFAVMARVDKVVIAPHAMLANGGIIGSVGMHSIALAARRHAVPFVCLGALYKLSPLFPHQPETSFNEFASPAWICDLETLALPLSGVGGASVQVMNPQFDYVPPDLIDLLVTDAGCHTPSYIYRLLNDYYSREDHLLPVAGLRS